MKKIAIPSRENKVDDHFGHCENFTVFTVEDNKVSSKEIVPSPQGCGCKSNIISVLKEKGVSVMLGGNMGQGAFDKISAADIQVIRGCYGDLDQLMSNYLAGKVKDMKIICDHHHDNGHSHGHQCNH